MLILDHPTFKSWANDVNDPLPFALILSISALKCFREPRMPSVSSFFNYDHDDRDNKVLNRDPAGTGAWKLKYFAPLQILAPEPYFLPLNVAPRCVTNADGFTFYLKRKDSTRTSLMIQRRLCYFRNTLSQFPNQISANTYLIFVTGATGIPV